MVTSDDPGWGRLNAGQKYGLLATDVGRALFGVAWGKYEWPLIYYVIEHSWGVARRKRRGEAWPDPRPCQVNLADLARSWGIPKQRLYEARDRLLEVGFLVRSEAGFLVNKNADQWIDPETREPLLSPPMLAYARTAQTRAVTPDPVTLQRDWRSHSSVTHKSSSVTSQRDSESHSSVTGGHTPALPAVTLQRDFSVGAIEERARKKTFKTPEDLEKRPPTSPHGGTVCVETRDGALVPLQGDEASDPAEVDRVAALADRLFDPQLYFGTKVRQFATMYPPAWIAQALETAAASDRRVGWRYIHGILQRWHAEGGPPAEPRSGRGRPASAEGPRLSTEEATARLQAMLAGRKGGRR